MKKMTSSILWDISASSCVCVCVSVYVYLAMQTHKHLNYECDKNNTINFSCAYVISFTFFLEKYSFWHVCVCVHTYMYVLYITNKFCLFRKQPDEIIIKLKVGIIFLFSPNFFMIPTMKKKKPDDNKKL